MIKNKLELLGSGEGKLGGYGKAIIDYVTEFQLMDEETWSILVNQFRIHSDNDNAWRGEYWGKMMRGACHTYKATKDKALYDVLYKSVEDLLTTQDELGRIASYPLDKEFYGWDMWSRKYVILGLLNFYDISKSKSLNRRIVKACKKHLDYIIKHVGNGKNKKGIFETTQWWGGLNSCSIIDAVMRLYMVTEEKRYLKFAEYIISTGFCKDINVIEACYNKTLAPYQFPVRKAYEMMSCFEGLLEYYMYTGEEKHLVAVKNFVELVKDTDFTIIGCCGCDGEEFDNSSVKQTEFKENIMQETCVTITFMNICLKLLKFTGDSKYADMIETSVYNALYGAVNNERQTMVNTDGYYWDENGRHCAPHEPFPFDSYSPLYQNRRGRVIGGFQRLQNGRSYGCCVCIASCGTAVASLYNVLKGDNSLYVNAYNDFKVATKLGETKVKLSVKANLYQRSGASITVNGEGKEFAVALRVPSWSKDFRVYVDGEEINLEAVNGYVTLSRVWSKNKISIKFKMPVIEHVLNGKVAFTRGPIVLARDERLDDIKEPLSIKAKDGKSVSAKPYINTRFSSNTALKLNLGGKEIKLVDYSQAGKNYDSKNCTITVWQDIA